MAASADFHFQAESTPLLASLALHAGLAALVIMLPQARRASVLRQPGIEVEFVNLPYTGPRAASRAMIRATRFMAAESLADPANGEARLALLQLADDDRMVQLCAVEAMEQIHAWRSDLIPDRLAAHAMAAPEVGANTIIADGAAFRSASQWFNVRFRCEVAPDRKRVVAFEFLVGGPVPRDEWERHYLPERY